MHQSRPYPLYNFNRLFAELVSKEIPVESRDRSIGRSVKDPTPKIIPTNIFASAGNKKSTASSSSSSSSSSSRSSSSSSSSFDCCRDHQEVGHRNPVAGGRR